MSGVAGDEGVSPARVAMVRTEAELGLRSLSETFPDLPRRPFRVVVHADAGSLPQGIAAAHHPGSPGLALLERHEIHLMLAEARASGAGLRPILVHELTHELLDQLCEPWGGRLPRWFHEGLAQVVAGDTYLGASEENIIWRALADQLLPFSSLDQDFPREPSRLQLAYAQSFSFVAWLEREYGRRLLLASVRAVDGETSFERALVIATRASTAELEDGWRNWLRYGSGAWWRVLLGQCFSLLMILALPLLALAMIRRLRADRAARERLGRAHESEQATDDPPEGT
jgi:hypothetical protein